MISLRSLLLGLLALAACDAPLADEAFILRDMAESPVPPVGGPNHPGTWPPPGGTFNTASLGVTPLMRLLPPKTEGLPQEGDGAITLIEVLDGGQYFPVTALAVPQGNLVLETAEGSYEGEEVTGSRWWLDEAKTHYITITEVSEAGPTHGYQLEHRYQGSDLSEIVCTVDVDGDHWAYLVEDVYVDVSDGTITSDDGPLLVACSSGALGKAITWGFSPWNDQDDTMALYRTGVRTVMADYCGDGRSYTEDGTLIQVSNALAGQSFGAPEAPTEAVFGPDGALCLTDQRFGNRQPLVCTIPGCEENGPLPSESFHAWTKLVPALP